MSRLTESLIQILIGAAIGILLIGSVILYKENIVAERVAEAQKITTLEASVRDYNQALRSCQETNQVISATKK